MSCSIEESGRLTLFSVTIFVAFAPSIDPIEGPMKKEDTRIPLRMDSSFALDTPLPPPRSSREHFKQSASSQDAGGAKTQSIPILNRISRTNSEILLSEDQAFAEYKDNVMYNRVVTGIIRQQEQAIATRPRSRSLDSYHHESQACISNILRTRHLDDASLHSQRRGSASIALENGDNHFLTQTGGFLAPTMPPMDDDDQVFALDL